MAVKRVIEERIIWLDTFSSIKECYSSVLSKIVAVNLHIYPVWIDTWKFSMKVILLKLNVRSVLFARKMDVERNSDMPLNCKNMKIRTVGPDLFYKNLILTVWLDVSCLNFNIYCTVAKLDSIEACCSELGCMKTFTNKQCLKAHMQSCHQYIECEICGEKKLRKNIKQHLRQKHESDGPQTTIRCTYEGCSNVFSTVSSSNSANISVLCFSLDWNDLWYAPSLLISQSSNLRQHVKVVHLGRKPFACCFPGCGMRFGYKHVRDNHEKSGQHVYTDVS